MASYNMNQVKVGLKIMVDGDPCVIVDADFMCDMMGDDFIISCKHHHMFDPFVLERLHNIGRILAQDIGKSDDSQNMGLLIIIIHLGHKNTCLPLVL